MPGTYQRLGAEPGLNFLLHQISFKFKKNLHYLLFRWLKPAKSKLSFKLRNFTAMPSQKLLELAKTSDLLDIAEHYELPNVKRSMLKNEIKDILIQFSVDEENFHSSATSHILVTKTDLQLRE